MAVNSVYQREIVEVPFVHPDGKVLPHPALVVSCDDLQQWSQDFSMLCLYRQKISSQN